MLLLEWTAMAALCGCGPAHAGLVVRMDMAQAGGFGKHVGQVVITETPSGVVFCPALSDLAPGPHGIRLHENPRCDATAKDGKGVPGELPALQVDANGRALQPVLAPRLTLAQLRGRSLTIHAGGDAHADGAAAPGSGAARLACGVIR